MKKKSIIIVLLVLIILTGGGIAVWKITQDKTSNQQGNKNPSSPKEELEKYLLEKRLDLQKYFVFFLYKKWRFFGYLRSLEFWSSIDFLDDKRDFDVIWARKILASDFSCILPYLKHMCWEGGNIVPISKKCKNLIKI